MKTFNIPSSSQQLFRFAEKRSSPFLSRILSLTLSRKRGFKCVLYALAIYIYNKQQQNSSFIKNVGRHKNRFFCCFSSWRKQTFFVLQFSDENLRVFVRFHHQLCWLLMLFFVGVRIKMRKLYASNELWRLTRLRRTQLPFDSEIISTKFEPIWMKSDLTSHYFMFH